jgi:hypothetical protein
MNENQRLGPGEAEGDGRAQHGYRNEVSWDGGKGRQPYTNQGDEETGPATAKEFEGGNAGDASGRTMEQLEQLKQKPERPEREAPRET